MIFPIKDPHGYVIGFGGRSIVEGENPKYLNSPETPLYQKSQVLFGMDVARQAIRKQDQAILVEGYLDQMRAAQYGILNTVATCGTALTSRQAGMLRNYASSVVLVFDSDNAGRAAADKGFDVLHENVPHMTLVLSKHLKALTAQAQRNLLLSKLSLILD